ncbi:four helix bundle protein [Patescibacteria group bacterium]
MDLVVEVYKLTDKYPRSELFVLTSHTRKTSISIPSNIAEGRRRYTRKEYRRFLSIAFASGAELETQIEIAKKLSYCQKTQFKDVDSLLDEVMRILNVMISKLK